MIKRQLQAHIQGLLDQFPAVAILGAKAGGQNHAGKGFCYSKQEVFKSLNQLILAQRIYDQGTNAIHHSSTKA